MFLNLESIYSSSWNIFKKNWWEYVLVSLITALMLFIPLGGILQFFMMMLMINAVIKVTKGNAVTFSDFFNFKDVLKAKVIIFAVVLGLYSFLMQAVNSVALSVVLTAAGFIASIIFFPVLCVLIDKDLGIKETILYSAKLTKNIRAEILLVMFVNFLIGVIGILLLLVGMFVAMPVITISTVKIYIMLDERLNSNTNANI